MAAPALPASNCPTWRGASGTVFSLCVSPVMKVMASLSEHTARAASGQRPYLLSGHVLLGQKTPEVLWLCYGLLPFYAKSCFLLFERQSDGRGGGRERVISSFSDSLPKCLIIVRVGLS